MALRARNLGRRPPELPFGQRLVTRSFAVLVVAVAASLSVAEMPAVAATPPTSPARALEGIGVSQQAGCVGNCAPRFAAPSLRPSVSAASEPNLTTAAQAQPPASPGYQCVPYSQYPAVKPGQLGSVSARLGGYTLTYSAVTYSAVTYTAPGVLNRGLAYPGVLTVAEGGHTWLLPRPVDPGKGLQLAGLCAVRFGAGQAPAVLAESSTGGQCCLVPTIYAYSTSTKKYVVAEDFTKPGVGRGLHWQAEAGFSPERVGSAVVLKSYDGAFQFSFGCFACTPLPTRLFTLTDDRLVDVTLHYPSVIRTEKDAAWEQARKYMHSSGKAVGVEAEVLQWAADSCELGEGASMWRTVERLEADGVFREAEQSQQTDTHGPFAPRLRSLLLVNGYCAGQLPASSPTPTTTPATRTPAAIDARLVCAAIGTPVGTTNSDGLHCVVTYIRRSAVDHNYAYVVVFLDNAQGQEDSDGAAALVDLATGSLVIPPNPEMGDCQSGYVPPPHVPPAVLASLGLPTSCARTAPSAVGTSKTAARPPYCTLALAEELADGPSSPAALREEITTSARAPYGGIADITCVEVTGNEQDLELSVSSGGSAGFIAWAVFRYTKSGWKLAGWNAGPGPIPIGFLHGDVIVTEGVYEPGDAHCCPSGGYKHYEYHWNGTHFVQNKSWQSKTASLTAPAAYPTATHPTPTSTPGAPTAEATAARLVCPAKVTPVGPANPEGLHCAAISFRRSPLDPDYAVVWTAGVSAQGQIETDSDGALVDLATGSVVVRPDHLFGDCQFGYVPPPQVPPAVLASLGLPTSCAKATAPASAERSEALAVNALLAQSSNDRNQVRSAISALTSCSYVATETTILESVASSRQSLLERLDSLGLDQLPNGARLQSVLERALSESVQADEDFAAWARDLLGNGCSPASATNDPNYQAATAPDNAAESAKAVFAGLWDPVARQFGLPAQSDNSF
jgi:hypothetical protein